MVDGLEYVVIKPLSLYIEKNKDTLCENENMHRQTFSIKREKVFIHITHQNIQCFPLPFAIIAEVWVAAFTTSRNSDVMFYF